jgi:hypothetical protein
VGKGANRFSGFHAVPETVKTVVEPHSLRNTLLKQGVNAITA